MDGVIVTRYSISNRYYGVIAACGTESVAIRIAGMIADRMQLDTMVYDNTLRKMVYECNKEGIKVENEEETSAAA